MSNQDTIASPKVTTTVSNPDAFDVKNVVGNWDGLIYTFCYRDKCEQSNGFYPTYCIQSWGKDNTVMLMEMFKDYNYTITVKKHQLSVEN
tara:strand:- start:263 stop:532 length:270 start_codon:yes stop_codon:yes gene_type:complete